VDVGQVAVRFLIGGFDAHMPGGDAGAADVLDFEGDRQAERGEAVADRLFRHAGVEEDGQRHVAAGAAEAVEVSDAHENGPPVGGPLYGAGGTPVAAWASA